MVDQQKRVLVPIAEGFEEIETVSVIDILRRAGAKVVVASIMGKDKPLALKGLRDIYVTADAFLEDVIDGEFELIALPGGQENAESLAKSEILIAKLKKQKDEKKHFYAAICASPALVFQPHGLLEGEQGTCSDARHDKLVDKTRIQERVVVSNKCITSRGPGTSLEWSYVLVECLYGAEKANALAKTMIAVR